MIRIMIKEKIAFNEIEELHKDFSTKFRSKVFKETSKGSTKIRKRWSQNLQ